MPATVPARGHRRHIRRIASLGAVGLSVAALAACDYAVDAQTLHVVDAQEESFFSDGDEPYLAVIQFRVTPGVAGSTEVRYLGNLQELHSGADDGDSMSIPDAMGRAFFEDVALVGTEGLSNGVAPEIVGAVTVAMESDASPWSAINGIMRDVRDELDVQLRTQIETLTFADILNPTAAAARLEEAARRVEDAATPSFWEAVGIFFSSFGDPDDVIGFKVVLFVAVNDDVAPIIDSAFASGLPPEVVGRALPGGPLQVRYAGDGATYDVTFDVTAS